MVLATLRIFFLWKRYNSAELAVLWGFKLDEQIEERLLFEVAIVSLLVSCSLLLRGLTVLHLKDYDSGWLLVDPGCVVLVRVLVYFAGVERQIFRQLAS